MTQYDDKIIQLFADRLYARANKIIFVYTFLAFVMGSVIGVGIGAALSETTKEHQYFLIAPLLGIFFAIVGYLTATERAFRLKLEAQIALCQRKIEENTRFKT